MCSSCDNNIKEHIIKKLLTKETIEIIDFQFLVSALLFCLDDELKRVFLEYRYLDFKLTKQIYSSILKNYTSIKTLENNFYPLVVFLLDNKKLILNINDILGVIHITQFYNFFNSVAENCEYLSLFDTVYNNFFEYLRLYKNPNILIFNLLVKLGLKRNKKYEEAIDLLIRETNLLDGYY